MVFSVAALDVLYTLSTGVQASHAVTSQIDFDLESTGILGWMQEVGHTLGRMGTVAFGRYAPLVELLLYGMATPLLVAMPLAGESQRKRWPRSAAVVVLGLAVLGIGAWLGWEYPDLSAVYYALVNLTLRASHVVGVSYYTGSLLSFIILPLLVAVAYGGVLIWRSGSETTHETQKGSSDPSLPNVPGGVPEVASLGRAGDWGRDVRDRIAGRCGCRASCRVLRPSPHVHLLGRVRHCQ
jgi:hypothetical protein